MASGIEPVAFRSDLPLTCLGADCHSAGPSSMLHQMGVAINSDRATQASAACSQKGYPRAMRAKVMDAFNLATINGARAARMAGQIGSIAVGKLADLVILDTSTPAMVCAVDHDPLVAVVRHAGVREVDTVIVDGRIRKQHGELQPSRIATGCEQGHFPIDRVHLSLDQEMLKWSQVAEKLAVSRKDIQRRVKNVDCDLAKQTVLGLVKMEDDKLL
jgi:cytosine/adenosine deaminase-related metal-dependent hydrolase